MLKSIMLYYMSTISYKMEVYSACVCVYICISGRHPELIRLQILSTLELRQQKWVRPSKLFYFNSIDTYFIVENYNPVYFFKLLDTF